MSYKDLHSCAYSYMSIPMALSQNSLFPTFSSFSCLAHHQVIQGHSPLPMSPCIYSNLRPLLFQTNWIVTCTNQSSNNYNVFLSPLLFKANPELGCHATRVHFHLAPIYQAVLCINQAQTFSSSVSWSCSAYV